MTKSPETTPNAAAHDTAPASGDTRMIVLDTPIKRGETQIDAITLRRPKAGELRGLAISDLARLDVNAILKLLPRISTPSMTPQELEQLPSEELFDLATEAGSFLLKKSVTGAYRSA